MTDLKLSPKLSAVNDANANPRPKISIITHLSPDRTLDFYKQIESLELQTHRTDFELVVVTNGSVNFAPCIKNPKQIPISVYQVESQPYNLNRMRNVGAKWAEGEWLLFVDCDITFSSNLIEQAVRYTESPNPCKRNIVYTWPHCSTIDSSNNQGRHVHCVIDTNTRSRCTPLTQWDLARMLVDDTRRLNVGLQSMAANEFSIVPLAPNANISHYWNHPILDIYGLYKPDEFFFMVHQTLWEGFRLIGGWPEGQGQYGTLNKGLVCQYLIELNAENLIHIHTIAESILLHQGHKRPPKSNTYELKWNQDHFDALRFFAGRLRNETRKKWEDIAF